MTFHNPEDSPYALHNHKEIVFILEDLSKNNTSINLDTHEGAGLVTSVLGVDTEDNVIYLDIGHDPKTNEKIKKSHQITFSTQTGVKVRWYSTHLDMIAMTDGDAFYMEIPSVIERIQRREYFRLDTPKGSRALICKIPAGEDIIEVIIEDMSVGGLGLSVKGTPHEIFSQGAMLDGCSVEFPAAGSVPFRLRICGIWPSAKTKSGEIVHHIGMEFVNVSRGVESVIQRYMVQLERDRISLK